MVNIRQFRVSCTFLYDPFGMLLPGREWQEGYRFGFNGKENLDELYSDYCAIDFGARVYDSRFGRWMSVDPKSNKYPGWSNYVFVRNSPLTKYDPDGKTDYDVTYKVSNDKEGNILKVVAEVTIVYQILDLNSSLPIDDVSDVKENNSSYSVKFNGYYINNKNEVQQPEITVNINIKYEVIKDYSQIDDKKNVMLIVDKVNDSKESIDVLARGNINGQVLALEFSQRLSLRVILHEMGHNLGFWFEGSKSNGGESHSDDPSHLMYESPDGYGGTGTETNPSDFKPIFGWLMSVQKDGSEHHSDDNGSNAKQETKQFIQEAVKSYNKDKAKKAGL